MTQVKRERKSVNQQIFDKVVRHLWKQNEQSTPTQELLDSLGADNTAMCVYRGKNNTSCAVGCLISDRHYQQSFDKPTESTSGTAIGDRQDVQQAVQNTIRRPFEYNTVMLMSRLQGAHDSGCYKDVGYRYEGMYDRLKQIAGMYSLNTKVLDRVFRTVKAV